MMIADLNLKPGYGMRTLHLGMATAALENEHGPAPECRPKGSFREYWMYAQFDCLISRKSNTVLSFFLRPGALRENSRTWNEQSVLSEMGAPQLSGGGFYLSDGQYVDRWLSYDAGIGFHFQLDGRLTTLSVFRKRRQRMKMLASAEQKSFPRAA